MTSTHDSIPTHDELTETREQASAEHLEAYSNARRFVQKLLKREQDQVSEGVWDTETSQVVVYTPEIRKLVGLVGCLKICIQGERESLDMEVLGERRAIEKVQQLGFILQLPDGSIALDS